MSVVVDVEIVVFDRMGEGGSVLGGNTDPRVGFV